MKFYQPGTWIPYSGVYRVIHQEHMHSHEVTCISGETFPECLECGPQVRFVLLSAARSIKKHAMFAKDSSRPEAARSLPHSLELSDDLDHVGG